MRLIIFRSAFFIPFVVILFQLQSIVILVEDIFEMFSFGSTKIKQRKTESIDLLFETFTLAMDKRKRLTRTDSALVSSAETIANLDPLIQSTNVQTESGIQGSSTRMILTEINPTNKDATNFIVKKSVTFLQRFTGVFYSLMASLLFTSSNFFIKQLDVVLLDVFLVRFIFQGLILVAYIVYKGYFPFAETDRLLFFIRSLVAASGSVFFYLALSMLPLPDLTTLRYTQVIWTALVTLLIFRQRINCPTLIASVMTIIGVIFVTQPSFLFATTMNINGTTNVSLSSYLSRTRPLGIIFALACAFSISTAIVLNKKLLEKHIRQSIIMLHFIGTTFLVLLIMRILYWTRLKPKHINFNFVEIYLKKDFIVATILATLQLIPMVLSQKSIKLEHPSIFTIVQASDILFALIFQNLFSTVKTNGLALLGSMLVLTSIVLVGIHKLWQDRQQQKFTTISMEENTWISD